MIIITTDLHLTDKKKDSYRFGVFKFLRKKIKKYNADAVFILGDITDLKDNHSSFLVNKITTCINSLAKLTEVYILRGNHDCIDANWPFFEFVNLFDNVKLIKKPTTLKIELDGELKRFLFLPHERDPKEAWESINFESNYDFIFMHQTIAGAKASNGTEMEGISRKLFKHCTARIFSGDIHVPQKLGKIEYVGSPYRINFGDKFEPRVLLLDAEDYKEIKFRCLKKHTIKVRSAERIKYYEYLKEGDQVKVKLKLPKSSFVDWEKHKKEVIEVCAELGLDLHGVELEEKKNSKLSKKEKSKKSKRAKLIKTHPIDIVTEHCKKEKVGNYVKEVGFSFLGD